MATNDQLVVFLDKMQISRATTRLLYCGHAHEFSINLSNPGHASMTMSDTATECLRKVGIFVE